MNQAKRDAIYAKADPETRAYIDLLENMGRAATQLYSIQAHQQYPPESLVQLGQALVALGWIDEEEESEYIASPPIRNILSAAPKHYSDLGSIHGDDTDNLNTFYSGVDR